MDHVIKLYSSDIRKLVAEKFGVKIDNVDVYDDGRLVWANDEDMIYEVLIKKSEVNENGS